MLGKSRWVIYACLLIALVMSSACMHLEKSYTEAVIHYEEYQEIFNTVQQIDSNICNKMSIPITDQSFTQISKAQQINALQSSLNRWVNDYNAKSKMINRSIWKSNSLPYQLNAGDYPCYSKSLISTGDQFNVQKNINSNAATRK